MDPTIKDFEAAIAELEAVVKKLEDGDLALETSLALVRTRRPAVALLPRPARRRRAAHRSAQRRGELTAAPPSLGEVSQDEDR